jgi:hypothetical protein
LLFGVLDIRADDVVASASVPTYGRVPSVEHVGGQPCRDADIGGGIADRELVNLIGEGVAGEVGGAGAHRPLRYRYRGLAADPGGAAIGEVIMGDLQTVPCDHAVEL